MHIREFSAWMLAAALLVAPLAGCSFRSAQTAEEVGAAADWTAPGGAADESGFSRLDEIDTGNVDSLGLAWSLDLPGEVTLEATPIAVDGVLYFSGSYATVYAVDGVSGKLLWKFDPQTWRHNPDKLRLSFGVNRGVAYENGKVFVAGIDGRLFALDAASGQQIWMVETIPADLLNTSTGAPRTMNGKVIIGNAGADFGSRGFVTAFDSASGKLLWRFFTVPGSREENEGDRAMEAAARTWTGEWWTTGTGGTVWNGITFDPQLDRVYIGVGNPGPYDPAVRSPNGGDNLYTTSIVALDANTGEYVWHYQENPRDAWDYKSTPNIIMANLHLLGEPREVLLHAPTNGFFYVLDRNTGKLISAEKATYVNWAKSIDLKTGRPVEEPNIRYEMGYAEIWPGTVGGHNWQAMSYNPMTGLVYIPMQQIGARFSRASKSEGAFNVMGLYLEPIIKVPGDGKGSLVAWDPVSQTQRWKVEHPTLWNGGTLTTAGGLVFQGTADGWFNAYDAVDGTPLWRFNAGLGIIAAPMSFSAGGRQYLSVLVGYGGAAAANGKFMDVGWKYGRQPRRLLTFVLDGKVRLPNTAPADMTIHALDVPGLVLDPTDVAAGRALSIRCAACHGVGLHSTGTPGPDLRESAIALDFDSFRSLLREGPLMERGMPRFDELQEREIRQLHAYIRSRARDALGGHNRDGQANAAASPLRTKQEHPTLH